MKSVTVIIPTLNEEKTIGSLLTSLFNNSYPKKKVIVVDGGSTDSTIEIVAMSNATLLREHENKCPANARNMGARTATSDLICFIEGDSLKVNRHFIRNLAACFTNKKTIAAYPLCKNIRDTWLSKIVATNTCWSILPMIRRDIFLYMGGFPQIGYGEDRLFHNTITSATTNSTFNTKHVKTAIETGYPVRTLRELYKQKLWYGRTAIPYLKQLSK